MVNPVPIEPRKKRRIFMWVFLAVQALFLIWVIAGASGASGTPDDCGTLDAALCNDVQSVGTGIGIALVIVLWVAVDFIMGVSYAIFRLARRP
jgi:hypothetical protein